MSTNVKSPVAVKTKLLSVLTPLVHLHVLVQKGTIQTIMEVVGVCVNFFTVTSLKLKLKFKLKLHCACVKYVTFLMV